MTEIEISNLIRVLGKLPKAELVELVEILKSPAERSALAKIIDGVAALTKRSDVQIGYKQRPDRIMQSTLAHTRPDYSSHGRSENVRLLFTTLLSDRRVFPGTKDVVDAANRYLDIGADYERFKRSGRRDLIDYC